MKKKKKQQQTTIGGLLMGLDMDEISGSITLNLMFPFIIYILISHF
jgi:hypothetical protein